MLFVSQSQPVPQSAQLDSGSQGTVVRSEHVALDTSEVRVHIKDGLILRNAVASFIDNKLVIEGDIIFDWRGSTLDIFVGEPPYGAHGLFTLEESLVKAFPPVQFSNFFSCHCDSTDLKVEVKLVGPADRTFPLRAGHFLFEIAGVNVGKEFEFAERIPISKLPLHLVSSDVPQPDPFINVLIRGTILGETR